MGPQAFARGDYRRGRYHPCCLQLQWGRRLSPAETPELCAGLAACHCFNGAAGFRPRRRKPYVLAVSYAAASMGPQAFARGDMHSVARSYRRSSWLQWGRRLSPAETHSTHHRRLRLAGFNGAAGFRPRRRPSRSGVGARAVGFNGAAGFRPRRLILQKFARVHHLASMGPQAFARGDYLPRCDDIRINIASMGPQAFARGDCTMICNQKTVLGASMGPQAFARGDDVEAALDAISHLLQWGRRLSPAETAQHTDDPGLLESPTRSCFDGDTSWKSTLADKSPDHT